jgi:hypothetical protein
MNKEHLDTIVISRNLTTVRFGWVSASTGLIYCGICLRAPITPELGSACPVCDARVSQLLDLRGPIKHGIDGGWTDCLQL